MIAGQLAGMIRNVIITRWNSLVASVRGIFQNIVNQIRSRLANAVSTAKSKAREIYTGIKNKVAEIPQMVADEFNKIKDKIRNALDNAKNIAVSKISELVAAVKGALGIASPGYVQRMMVYEFGSVAGIINDESVGAIKSAGNMATGIVSEWNKSMGDGLSIPLSELNEKMVIGDVIDTDAFNPARANLNTQLLSAPLGQNSGIVQSNSSVASQNIVNEGEKRTIIVEHFHNTMEMGNLTKEQSRRVLYDALDGLYKGV
jgi:hypothetical protein